MTNNIKEHAKQKVAVKITGATHLLTTRFARFMNRLFFKRSWPFLVIFCITAGGCSVCVLLKSFLSEPVASFDPGTIKLPVHLQLLAQPNELSGQYVDRQMYEQIAGFKAYMDSLKSQGNPLYDSVTMSRPHLMDSLTLLEEMYHSQNK